MSSQKEHDSFAKELLSKTYERWGVVEVEHELTTPPLHADLLFEPSGAPEPTSPLLPLLWRMGQGPALLEVFSDTPSLDDCLDIAEKALRAHRNRRPRSPGDDPAYLRPLTWIISPGRPEQAITQLQLVRSRGWPRGFLHASPALHLRLVVVAELPATHRTLILRMFGSDPVQQRAFAELGRLDKNTVTTLIAETFSKWYAVMTQPRRHFLNTDNPELMAAAEALYQKHLKDVADAAEEKGIEKGIEKGTLAPLEHLFGRRLRRPLTAEEREVLRLRLASLGADRLSDIVLDITEADALEAWLKGSPLP